MAAGCAAIMITTSAPAGREVDATSSARREATTTNTPGKTHETMDPAARTASTIEPAPQGHRNEYRPYPSTVVVRAALTGHRASASRAGGTIDAAHRSSGRTPGRVTSSKTLEFVLGDRRGDAAVQQQIHLGRSSSSSSASAAEWRSTPATTGP